jgi:hypothetical protein
VRKAYSFAGIVVPPAEYYEGTREVDLRLEIGDLKLEIGDWRFEIGDWRLEI